MIQIMIDTFDQTKDREAAIEAAVAYGGEDEREYLEVLFRCHCE